MSDLSSVHLNGLRAVAAVARCGSLPRAAEELGVSASAVSQQVNRTERQLGRQLFERTRSGLKPTEFGAAFAARLAAGFGALAEAVAMARRREDDTVVVSVAPAFAARFLVPRLGRFYAAHPEVMLRIDASTRLAELGGDNDVDLAIRLGDGHWPGVSTSLLLPQRIFPVCAPSLAARLGAIADLRQVCAISDQGTMIDWSAWFAAAGSPPVSMMPGTIYTDPMLCLEAAIAGYGVMLAWQLLAADALAAGRLVTPFDVRADSGLGYYLVAAEQARRRRPVAAFARWLAEEAAA